MKHAVNSRGTSLKTIKSSYSLPKFRVESYLSDICCLITIITSGYERKISVIQAIMITIMILVDRVNTFIDFKFNFLHSLNH